MVRNFGRRTSKDIEFEERQRGMDNLTFGNMRLGNSVEGSDSDEE